MEANSQSVKPSKRTQKGRSSDYYTSFQPKNPSHSGYLVSKRSQVPLKVSVSRSSTISTSNPFGITTPSNPLGINSPVTPVGLQQYGYRYYPSSPSPLLKSSDGSIFPFMSEPEDIYVHESYASHPFARAHSYPSPHVHGANMGAPVPTERKKHKRALTTVSIKSPEERGTTSFSSPPAFATMQTVTPKDDSASTPSHAAHSPRTWTTPWPEIIDDPTLFTPHNYTMSSTTPHEAPTSKGGLVPSPSEGGGLMVVHSVPDRRSVNASRHRRRLFLRRRLEVLQLEARKAVGVEQVKPLHPVLAVTPPSLDVYEGIGAPIVGRILEWLGLGKTESVLPRLLWDVRRLPSQGTIMAIPARVFRIKEGEEVKRRIKIVQEPIGASKFRQMLDEPATDPPCTVLVVCIKSGWGVRVRSNPYPSSDRIVRVRDVIETIYKALESPGGGGEGEGAKRVSTLGGKYQWLGLEATGEMRVQRLTNGEVDGGVWKLVLSK